MVTRKHFFAQLLVISHLMHAMSSHQKHEHFMRGMYGNYPMLQDSTGTSWMPASIAIPNIHFTHHGWMSMILGYINGVYDQQGGPRGGKKVFSENMVMYTTQKTEGAVTGAFRGMFCVEPGTIGASGYPLLLQTGETANGKTPLIDRQHPHDLFMELAVAGSAQYSQKTSLFGYLGFPGEPALGPTAFMHRFSAIYNPEAPITHHWLDSTHISFGVATVGIIRDWFKLDASIFTGREPDQHRWGFDRPRFDSYAIRASAAPTDSIALQISHAYIKSPEQLEPCTNILRTTASIMLNASWRDDTYNCQTTIAWGRNHISNGRKLNGFLLESTLSCNARHIVFGRIEWVRKDGLFAPPNPRALEAFNVGKIDGGYLLQAPCLPHTNCGIGVVASISWTPSSIERVYDSPVASYMVFIRMELAE